MIPPTVEEFIANIQARAAFVKSHKTPRKYTRRKPLEVEPVVAEEVLDEILPPPEAEVAED